MAGSLADTRFNASCASKKSSRSTDLLRGRLKSGGCGGVREGGSRLVKAIGIFACVPAADLQWSISVEGKLMLVILVARYRGDLPFPVA